MEGCYDHRIWVYYGEWCLGSSSQTLDKTIVTSKWLYKIKHAAEGSTEKYKARFVARGFSQKEVIDYNEIFAPVSRYTTIRSIIALAVHKDGTYIRWMSRLRSCMARSKKRSTWSNPKDLRFMIENLMYAGWRKLSMGWSKHLEHGMTAFQNTSPARVTKGNHR